jgi:hypothetical protein
MQTALGKVKAQDPASKGKHLSGRSVYPGDKDGMLYINEDPKQDPDCWEGKYFVLTKSSLRFYGDQENDSTGKAQGEFLLLNFTSVGEVSPDESPKSSDGDNATIRRLQAQGALHPPPLSPVGEDSPDESPKSSDGDNAAIQRLQAQGDLHPPPLSPQSSDSMRASDSMEYQFRVLHVEKVCKIGGKTQPKELLLCALSQFEMDAWIVEIQRSIQWIKDSTVEKDIENEDDSLVHRTDSLWRGSVEMDARALQAFSPRAKKEAGNFPSKAKKEAKTALSDLDWAAISGNVQVELRDDGADIEKGDYLLVASCGTALSVDKDKCEKFAGNIDYHRRFCQLEEKTVSGISSCVIKIFKNHMQKIPIAVVNLQRMIVVERSLDDSCAFSLAHPHNISLTSYNFKASSDTQRAFWEHRISEALQNERHRQIAQHQTTTPPAADGNNTKTIVSGGSRELPTVDVLSIKVLSAQNITSKVATSNDFFATVRVGEHLVKTETTFDIESPEWKNGAFELDILAKPDFVEVAVHAEPHHGHRPVYIGKTNVPILACLGDDADTGAMYHELISTGRYISGDICLHLQLFPEDKPTDILVKVVEVRNLPCPTHICNPFVQVTFRDVKKKTTVKHACLNAIFDDEECFDFALPLNWNWDPHHTGAAPLFVCSCSLFR